MGKVSSEQRKEIVKMYKDKSNTFADIAKRFGIAQGSVVYILKKEGQPLNRDKARTAMLRANEKKICDMYLARQSAVEIGETFGVGFTTIYNVLRRNGIELRDDSATGYKHTPEAKEKIAEAQRGRSHADYKKFEAQRGNSRGGQRKVGTPKREYGERYMTRQGYAMIHIGPRKYIMEHRIIMEQHLGRPLETWEQIHHINGRRDDNRLENLTIVNRHNHYGEIRCPHCGQTFMIK